MQKVNFISNNITIVKTEKDGKEYASLKYTHGDKYMYITSALIKDLEEKNVEILIDNKEVSATEKGLYSGFWKRVCTIKYIAQTQNEIVKDLYI
ncbi:hypothetical protein VSU16_14965 (plasmid) [Cetobacterium somerae]|uniref:hypothetical protein n=1 Tax=Cetobacterium somerae TaxID=188913 RepID=UPI002E7B4961|nr:hypothetical protein [Cetobacterium somerae]WVJ03029.1 hypothetical protein VSU16_14965 [Cetobacterium somerae]